MEWLININFWGVVHGTRAFLPHLSQQREAHIVNLSSIFGIIAPPGQTAYCAAKFAVRGFSESLRHELAMANSPVKLSVVHPGGVLTNIVRNSRTGAGITDNARRAQSIDRFDAIAKTTPPAAAQRIITGIEKNQPRILIGNDARFMDLLQRFRPATYWAVLAKRIEKMAGRRGSEADRRTVTSPLVGEGRIAGAQRQARRMRGASHAGTVGVRDRHSIRFAFRAHRSPDKRRSYGQGSASVSLYRPTSLSAKYPIVLR